MPTAETPNTHTAGTPPRRHAPLPYWVCQIGGWAALWLAEVVDIPDAASGPVYPLATFLRHLLFYGSAVALTHGWRWIIRRRAWARQPLRDVWWRVLLGTFVLASVHNLLNTGRMIFCLPDYGGLPTGTILLIFATYGLLAWIEFAAWTGIYLGYHAYSQLHELRLLHANEESARRTAALQALKAQIRPHFLFNSLNTVRALIPSRPDRARDAVTHLANILRASLDTHEQPLIPLSQEMEMVSSYLTLEQLRHEERLQVEIRTEQAAECCLVPPFVVQTLVENAVKHGIDHLPEGGVIRIESHLNPEGLLEIKVTNPGRPGPLKAGGHGLANARHRLFLLGGADAGLDLRENPLAGTVTATLRFPHPPPPLK